MHPILGDPHAASRSCLPAGLLSPARSAGCSASSSGRCLACRGARRCRSALPIGLVAAPVSLSAWYLCRAMPLDRTSTVSRGVTDGRRGADHGARSGPASAGSGGRRSWASVSSLAHADQMTRSLRRCSAASARSATSSRSPCTTCFRRRRHRPRRTRRALEAQVGAARRGAARAPRAAQSALSLQQPELHRGPRDARSRKGPPDVSAAGRFPAREPDARRERRACRSLAKWRWPSSTWRSSRFGSARGCSFGPTSRRTRPTCRCRR